jgi:GNAT superfamily N-acetyltransferase
VAAVALRFAGPGDAGLIEALVREHAAEEGALGAVRGSTQDYARAGFALFFANFSSWEGRPGLFLEDLFVRRQFRGLAIGRRLVAELARLAKARAARGWIWWWRTATRRGGSTSGWGCGR